METLNIQNEGSFSIDKIPDQCPLCHHAIKPIEWSAADYRRPDQEIERLLQCPRAECKRLFLALYVPGGGQHILKRCMPANVRSTGQSLTIARLSPDFCAIFDQANKAEQYGLVLVAGPGYRKALEFLMKDYIIEANPEEKEKVERVLLGRCIATYVKNDAIKEMAKRAAWLGNDETHFVRQWQEKDLQHLKELIRLTLLWIEMESLTANALKDMPEAGPASKN